MPIKITTKIPQAVENSSVNLLPLISKAHIPKPNIDIPIENLVKKAKPNKAPDVKKINKYKLFFLVIKKIVNAIIKNEHDKFSDDVLACKKG